MKSENSKKTNKPMRILTVILCVLVAVLIVIVAFVWINFSKLSGDLGFDKDAVGEEYETDPEAEGLPEVTYSGGNVSPLEKSEETMDIMLLGVDNRDITKFTGRSDVTMYLRIDTKKQSIKLASLMRDTLVPIEGHDKNKLNTAYNFGSIELTNKTLLQNFGLKPDYYMVVNFYGMEDIIDVLGGVDIDIKSEELESLTNSITEINALDKNYNSPYITEPGMHHLNGRQAVAYMRIRHPGGDATRILRQQKVLSELFDKATKVDILMIPALIDTIARYVRTDIPATKMLDIANAVKKMGANQIKKFRYPEEYEFGRYKKMSIVQPKDFYKEIKKLHDFLTN
ncbi:MAG: LCP family protein [Christensenellales bacterium]|jgi:LCP family protein required for cell wall assembly